MKSRVVLAAALSISLPLLFCGCGKDGDYSENEYFKCTFEADDPSLHIRRSEGIPYTLKCVSKKDRVRFSNISVSVYHKKTKSRDVHTMYRGDRDRYDRYARRHRPRVTSSSMKRLAGEYIGEKEVTVTPGSPLVLRGVIRHSPVYKLYHEGRSLYVGAAIFYPDHPLARAEDRGPLREDQRKNRRKYWLGISQDID